MLKRVRGIIIIVSPQYGSMWVHLFSMGTTFRPWKIWGILKLASSVKLSIKKGKYSCSIFGTLDVDHARSPWLITQNCLPREVLNGVVKCVSSRCQATTKKRNLWTRLKKGIGHKLSILWLGMKSGTIQPPNLKAPCLMTTMPKQFLS